MPYSAGPLWTSVDTGNFFTKRLSPRRDTAVDWAFGTAQQTSESPSGESGEKSGEMSGETVEKSATAVTQQPFVVSLSHFVPRQALVYALTAQCIAGSTA